MCGPHIEIRQQEGVFDDYRTVADRLRRYTFSAPLASRGKKRVTTGTVLCFTTVTD